MSKIIDAKKNGYQITYTGEKAERFIRPNGEYQQLSYGDGTTTVSSHKADGIKTAQDSMSFDKNTGKILKKKDANGIESSYSYDDGGKGGEQNGWVNEYLVRKIKTEVDYQELDAAGLVKFLKTDKEKEETKTVTSYDDHGQPTTVTTTKEGAPDSVEQTTCQDTVQGTTRTTTTTQGEEKETSVIKTDAMGRETENTSKDRKGNILSSTETSYDFMGRAIQTKVTSDGVTQTESKTYDDNGTVATETSASGIKTAYRYDSLNRVIKATESADGTDTVTETAYGYEDAQIHTLNGTKNYQNLSVQTTKTDGNGDQISYAYDDQNRVTEITQGGQKTKVSYQVNSDESTTTSVTDANGHVKQETASASGSVTTTSDLGDGSESITTKYTYDDRGNKISEVYANGAKKTYEYNSRNLVTKTQSYDKEGTKTLISRYRYDDYGQLLEMTDYRVSSETETAYRYTEYTYDQGGRITAFAEISQNTQPTADDIKAHQIRYTYNEDGNLSKVSYPTTKDGIQSLSYIYDENGWLQEIKGELHSNGQTTEKVLRSYSYDAYGKVKEIKDYRNRLKNGAQAVQKIYTYDSFDRVKEMTYTDLETGKVMESYRYSYDKNSNITEKTEVNNYPKEEKDKVNETKAYTYDALGRLTKTVTTDHKNDDKTKTVTYTYDKAGNRTTEDDGTTQTAYTYNGLDQLQTATKEKGTAVDEVRQYSYDANGNQTDVKNTKTGQTESYTYDAENRLSKVSVTDKDGKTAVIQQNHYNGDGQRIQKVEGSKTTNYYYQDGVVSYTTDGENSQTSQNLIGTDGNILATQRYGSDHTDYLLYHKDIQGSTTSLVKEDGSADATYRYTDFGETTINGDNKAENEVCYTGGIYDHSTGLYYLNARYYNPEDGRFVTEDTYRGETAKPETGHLYAYCANNPVNYVDPSGHKAKTVIYYNKKGKDFKKQAMHSPYYKNSQVTFKSVIKKAQFKKEWDKIPKGTSELYLYLHGGVSCLYFDGSDMNLKELLALKKKKIKKKIVLLSCKGGIGDKNSVAKIMAKKCQCVVYASSYPYGLSYRYDKKKKVYYPRYGGKRNYYNHENPLKKYKP